MIDLGSQGKRRFGEVTSAMRRRRAARDRESEALLNLRDDFGVASAARVKRQRLVLQTLRRVFAHRLARKARGESARARVCLAPEGSVRLAN